MSEASVTGTCVIGVDFGTLSARAAVVRVVDGAVLGSAEHAYPHAVIDTQLQRGAPLPRDWALQHPLDWLEALERSVCEARKRAGVAATDICGIGVDFTASTVLPVTSSGAPLCLEPVLAERPHAWPKLWKHHAAQPEADQINELARARGEPWLARYGGLLSAEWSLPKSLEILRGDPQVAAATDRVVEAVDWIVGQLSGGWYRNSCAAGYKGCSVAGEPGPEHEFLDAVHPGLAALVERSRRDPIRLPGSRAGRLSAAWAQRLQLSPETVVAIGMIDAHAATLGVGIDGPGVLFMMLGTSTCHMLMSAHRSNVPGVSGVIRDGILSGLYGYEAGQAAVGDMFAWFADRQRPADAADEAARRAVTRHQYLSERAQSLPPGAGGLVALDWLNGCRTPLVDARLSGAIVGLTLQTSPEAIYRALIEATAFGTAAVVENFEAHGVAVERLVASGSPARNSLLTQIYADVLDREVSIVDIDSAPALGAAMLAAAAAGTRGSGSPAVFEAVRKMRPAPSAVVRPRASAARVYARLFEHYRRLASFFGREHRELMHDLHRLRGAGEL